RVSPLRVAHRRILSRRIRRRVSRPPDPLHRAGHLRDAHQVDRGESPAHGPGAPPLRPTPPLALALPGRARSRGGGWHRLSLASPPALWGRGGGVHRLSLASPPVLGGRQPATARRPPAHLLPDPVVGHAVLPAAVHLAG